MDPLSVAILAEELLSALMGLVGPQKAKEMIDQWAIDSANIAADVLESQLEDSPKN